MEKELDLDGQHDDRGKSLSKDFFEVFMRWFILLLDFSVYLEAVLKPREQSLCCEDKAAPL